jgi:hypothetical protein
MKRKEILHLIASHPDKGLYIEYGSPGVLTLFTTVSKTSLLKNAKVLDDRHWVGTYAEFRTDLAPRYLTPADYEKKILLFRQKGIVPEEGL